MKGCLFAVVSLIAGFVQAEFSCSVSVGKVGPDESFREGTITWKNTGSAAVAAPYVRLDAGDGVSVRFSETEPWTKSLEFLATSPGAQASSLKGFEKGELKFLCQSPSDDGKLELSYTLASAEAFPWSDIGDSLKPSFVSDAAWAIALKTLKARLGTTWNSYLGRFRADADYLASSGRPVNRMDRLWQFEINRALGIDPAVSTLASAVDAARSARSLGVTLSRSYPSAMYARFNKGMFGYGWTDNLSVYAELTDATLTFRMPGGGSYSFAKAGGVWEPEDLRDKSTLTENASAYVLSYQNGTKQTFAKANMRTSSITDNSGNTLTFTWNGTQLAKVAHTDGQSLTFAYSNGLLVSATDDCGRKTTYAYSGDLLTSVTASDGLVTRYEYRAADGTAAARALSRITHPDGTATEFAYDAEGLVASVAINGGKEKTAILRADGVVTLVQPDGGKTVLKTGVSGEALETKDVLGGISVNRYTEDGLLKSMTAPSGLSGSLSHDALGRIAQSVSAGGNATAFAYEETFGNLKMVTDAKSHAVTYGYDAKGRGTSVSFPDGSMSKVEYNDRGDVVKSYNRRGQSIAYTYDARGRVTKKTWSTGRTFSYSYDAHGNVTTATDSETGTVTMEYDAAERMTKIVYPGGRGFTFAYDDCGRLARRASLDGVAERFQYDAQGRLASVTDDNGHAYLRNAYEESTGRLIRQENGNGTSTAYLYDKLGRVTSIEHCNAEGRIVEALQYCYDVDGRCIRASSLLGEERYGYDADGQLTGVDYPNDTYQSFAYDAVGNRTTSNKATYTVNAMNQYTQAEGGGEVTTFAYDADGNMISMMDSNGTITYTYDTLNRLVAVKNPTAGIDWSCKYDVFGNRVSVTENGVTTERVYLQGALPSVAAEYVNGQLKERHILVGAVRIADINGEAASSPLEQEGAIRYLHADLIGSVRLVTGDDGTVQDRASYLAFGGLRTGSVENSAGYVGTLGVETDSTGLLFMRNRYYSPDLGRFIQPDPIGMNGGDENWYRYCGNAPIYVIDPSGLIDWKAVSAGIKGAAKGVGIAALGVAAVVSIIYSPGTAAPVVETMLGVAKAAGYVESLATSVDQGVDLYNGHEIDWADWRENLLSTAVSYSTSEAKFSKYWHHDKVINETFTSIGEDIGVSMGAKIIAMIPIEKMLPIEIGSSGGGTGGGDTPGGGTGGGDTPGGGAGGGDTPGGGSGGGQINSQSDWVKISSSSNSAIMTYSLGADITINFDVDPNSYVVNIDGNRAWYGLGYLPKFNGRLNGNGHKIRITGTNLIGPFLFVKADGATFENVTFEGYAVRDANNCTFKNCRFTDYSLVADATSCTFDSCNGEADMAWLSGVFQVGALAQSAKSCAFTNCQVGGVVKGADNTGALVGDAEDCSFTSCQSSAAVSGVGSTGGLVGWAENCDFMNVVAYEAVSGDGQVGGLVGYSKNCNYSNCLAKGAVTGSHSVGGFAGDLRGGNVSKCSALGKVVCDAALGGTLDDIGGFAGQIINDANVEKCSAKGDVSAAGALKAGGFTGTITDSSVQGCWASGAVVGGGTVGGFVGTLMQGKTYNCCATGTVTAKGKSSLANAGGFAGMALSSGGADCRYCYASGKTTASGGDPMTTVAGGFTPLGVPDSMAATMGSYISMLMSESVACYWNVASTGCKYSGMGTGLTSANAKKQSSYSGWEFSDMWKMGSDGPEIQNVGATVSDDPESGGDEDDPSGGDEADPVAAVDIVQGTAGCSVKGTGAYKNGETVTLTAMPAADCLFDGWYSDPACTKLASTDATYSFTVEDPEQRVYAKFSTKESKLDATRLYSYDKYVAERGQRSVFLVDGTAPIGTALAVSGLPEGFDFYGDKLMIAGTPTRTMSTTITVTLSNAAGTKTKKIPFVVVAPEDEEEDASCAEFVEARVATKEGDVLRIPVRGGCADRPCSARLCLAYQSAAAADLDLTKASVDGTIVKSMKFPYVLNWAAGEFGEKIIEIPVKTDAAVEDDEVLTFQLVADTGIDIGERNICTVTIADENTFATLQDGVMNPGLKAATSGSGKWQVAAGNASDTNCVFGLYHAESPALQEGKSASLTFSSVKGTGTFYFWMRYSNAAAETTPSKLSVYVGKNFLASIEHGDVTDEWKKFYFTIEGSAKSTSSVAFEFTQGSDPNVHVELSNVYWDNGTAGKVYDVYAATVNTEGGYVTGSGPYAEGATAKLSAKARPGWTFSAWYTLEGGQYVYWGNKASVSYKVTDNLSIYAYFIKTPYVRGLADPADGGKVSGSGYVASGKKVTLKASANKNFTFEGWYAAKAGESERIDENVLITACASLVIDNSAKPAAPSKTTYVITNVTGDVTYFAKFKSYPEAFVSIEATDGNEYAGKITGTGKYAPGKKVTLKATANKGYVFAGWYEGGVSGGRGATALPSVVGSAPRADRTTALSQAASYAFTMPTNGVELVAAFVTTDEDEASISANVNGMAFGAGSGGEGVAVTKLATNVMTGVYLEWPIAADALSLPTVKVAGLPSGLKFTAKPVTSKVTSGTDASKVTTIVTNVAANTIYGAPTAASKTAKDKKTGLVTVKPSEVKVTVTTAGKNAQTYQIDMTVDPLPDWAVGTFAGPSYDGGRGATALPVDTNGVATVSVAASGKITAKQPVNGKSTSFAANYFDVYDAERDSFWATLTAKVGKEIVTNEMVVSGNAECVTLPDGSDATVTNGVIIADRFDAWQHNWKVEPWKAIGKSFDKREVSYEEAGVKVTLKFSANGTAKVAGEFATYDKGGNIAMKGGKPVTVKASGSATLLPTVGEDGEMRYLVFVYLAPKGLPPHARCMEIE